MNGGMNPNPHRVPPPVPVRIKFETKTLPPTELALEVRIPEENSHPASTISTPSSTLLIAIENGNYDKALRVLEDQRDPNIVNVPCGPLRITALQIVAAKGDDGIKFAKLLLEKGANPNSSDKLGRTPLHHAAGSGSHEMVNLMLEAGAAANSRFGIDSLLRPNNNAARDEPDGFMGLFKEKTRLESIDVIVGGKLPVPECWGRTPLHQAVKGSHPGCVQALLKGGANVNSIDESGLTPLLLAGAGIGADNCEEDFSKYEEIVDMLVSHGAQVNARNEDTGTTPLHHAAALCSVKATQRLLAAGASMSSNTCGETVLHEAAKQGCPQVVNVLLESDGRVFVNWQDQVGRTPLHSAAYAGARESLSLLIKHGGDLSISTSTNVTVMDAIFSNILRPINFLTDELDKCVTPNCANLNDRGFKIHVDFSVLSPAGTDHQMAVVSALMAGGNYVQQFHLLQHPLLETFLRLKWHKLRIFFLLLLTINVVFVFSLSFYVVMVTQDDLSMPNINKVVRVSRYILIVSASAIFFHGLAQIYMLPRHYLREYETWLSLACAFMSLVVSIYGETLDLRGSKAGKPDDWVMHVTSFAVLLAWAELMLLIGRFPTWGLYALMFYTVLQNVFKVLLAFICLVIGFAFSFAIQFHELPEFKNPWKAFVKTTVMMMGEFEFADMFNQTVQKQNQDVLIALPGTSRIIFLLFIVLTSIVLMNLMVGLAVSDIQALEKESHVRRRLKQAEFVAHLERFTSHHVLSCRCVPTRFHRLMDRRRCIGTSLHFQPAVNDTWTKKVSYDLLEALVNISMKNSSKAGHKAETSEPTERRRYSRTASMAAEEHHDTMSILRAIQREITEMRDVIESDRNTAKIIRHNVGSDINTANFELRPRRSSRTTGPPMDRNPISGKRFSDIVQGLQARHSNVRKMNSNRSGNANLVL